MSRAPAAIPTERVFFDFDSDGLSDDARQSLERVASWLRGQPGYRLLLEGHADERGADEYNLALGLRRAASVKRFLAAYGTDAGRMEVVSYGEERPLATGHDEMSWAQNRRAELKQAPR